MNNFIREIPSDSKIRKITIDQDKLKIIFELDIYEKNQNTKSIIFKNVMAVNINQKYKIDIEGIEIKTDSQLLTDTQNKVKIEDDGTNQSLSLKSYQILAADPDSLAVEIIATGYKFE